MRFKCSLHLVNSETVTLSVVFGTTLTCQRDLFLYKLAIFHCLTDPPFVRMANHGIRPRIKTRPQSSVCLQQRESSVRLVMYCWKAPGGLSGVCPLHTNSSQSRRCCPPNPAMDQPTELDRAFNKMLLMERGWKCLMHRDDVSCLWRKTPIHLLDISFQNSEFTVVFHY